MRSPAYRTEGARPGPNPEAYDKLMERLQEFEQRPYAIRMGRRDWTELRRDPRTLRALENNSGDGLTFMGVPVRVEKGRISGIPQHFDAKVYATADDLHEAIYG